jgi:hypothetical protein
MANDSPARDQQHRLAEVLLREADREQPTELVPLADVQRRWTRWPHGPWATGRLIREGKLGCIRSGKKIFLTSALIEDFIARHTVKAAS